jgi:hypothetical protein
MGEDLRFVQLTPPGSGCSIAIGQGLLEGEPGSVKGLQVVDDDVAAWREALSPCGTLHPRRDASDTAMAGSVGHEPVLAPGPHQAVAAS